MSRHEQNAAVHYLEASLYIMIIYAGVITGSMLSPHFSYFCHFHPHFGPLPFTDTLHNTISLFLSFLSFLIEPICSGHCLLFTFLIRFLRSLDVISLDMG